MEFLKKFDFQSWQEPISEQQQQTAIQALEQGQLLLLPELQFQLAPAEQRFLSPEYADSKAKNISFNIKNNQLRGLNPSHQQEAAPLRNMLNRFANQAQHFIESLFPHYRAALMVGRTSFRPVEVKGRVLSYRKDDTRLHVDAFPANPNQGKRILRLFSNINPHRQDRVWRLGEPFEKVVTQFLPRLKKPIPGLAPILKALHITKSYRTPYDHYMLQLHDTMKSDIRYQQQAEQTELRLPAGSSWIVQTDHVSHAAMAGQYMLEQTFYLPVSAMQNQQHAPLRVLEKLLSKNLV